MLPQRPPIKAPRPPRPALGKTADDGKAQTIVQVFVAIVLGRMAADRWLAFFLRAAVEILEEKKVDFEFDGEMMADVALNPDMAKLYPFSRLTKPANILIMPGLQSANISYKLLAELSGGRVIGPILWGMQKSIQITRMNSTSTDILNMAGLAAIGSLGEEEAFFPGF